MGYINYNGLVTEAGEKVFHPDNRSYRYGDGIFETMKVVNGKIQLADFHFDRLSNSLRVLEISRPRLLTGSEIKKQIKELCEKNGCSQNARVRFSVSRGDGGLYNSNDKFQYLIECWPLNEDNGKINENGLVIDIYPDARKSTDQFSNLKSANFLPYVMAAKWAGQHKLNDALVLNVHERICDATTANVFWAKDGKIFTPPLTEGCIAGIMRRFLLQGGNHLFNIREATLSEDELLNADEVFLTNAISGIRWIQSFRNKNYDCRISGQLFELLGKHRD